MGHYLTSMFCKSYYYINLHVHVFTDALVNRTLSAFSDTDREGRIGIPPKMSLTPISGSQGQTIPVRSPITLKHQSICEYVKS